MTPDTKQCVSCEKTQPITEFAARKDGKNKHRGQCKTCRRAYAIKWGLARRKFPDLIAADRLKARAKPKADNRYAHSLKKNYGLTPSDYERMAAIQNNLCAICGKSETSRQRCDGQLRRLSIDHNHESKDVRELLCNACNRGIGYLCDDPLIVFKAFAYLEKHKALAAAKANIISFPTPSPVKTTPQISCPTPKSHILNRNR